MISHTLAIPLKVKRFLLSSSEKLLLSFLKIGKNVEERGKKVEN